ncbi:hypothetical protein HR060_09505 [Catenovulum sp. SM1970]|uniref:hypothetical protein n=1 Tax=Marinifaba aquimaris TaxID=2741323 RepID=UPI0015742639|nr:hypothetical protein [Marinifaba aquimaris]NTS77109.1 hypothetical protein [Marinifaba aquimaris]
MSATKIFGFPVDAAKKLYKLFNDKQDANKKYKKLLPVLKTVIAAHGRNSSQANDVLDLLSGLVPNGARRNNFKRRYVDKKDGWRLLPDDPEKIPYGHWH